MEGVRTYVAERCDELRDVGAWAKAWFADPFAFVVYFMAAAAEHDGKAETDESSNGIEAG